MLMEIMMPWFLGGQAQVLAVARPNWTYVEKKVESPKDVPLISKVQKPKKSESEVKAEQADWIKRYMAEQAEVSFQILRQRMFLLIARSLICGEHFFFSELGLALQDSEEEELEDSEDDLNWEVL